MDVMKIPNTIILSKIDGNGCKQINMNQFILWVVWVCRSLYNVSDIRVENRLPHLLSRIDLLTNVHEKLVSELPDNAERVLVEEQAFELDFSV